jgi:hypothetical protein
MKRRGDQHAGARGRSQRGCDVGRVEGPPGLESRTAEQRQQHARLEAVHVLRRNGSEERHADKGVAPHGLRKPPCLGVDTEAQETPVLGVRHGRAGRPGGEHLDGQRVFGNQRHV